MASITNNANCVSVQSNYVYATREGRSSEKNFLHFALRVEDCPKELLESGEKIEGFIQFSGCFPDKSLLKSFNYSDKDQKLKFKETVVGTSRSGIKGITILYVLQPNDQF